MSIGGGAARAHDHVFGLDRASGGEGRTRIVVFLTVVTMGAEIAAGVAFGSMALLADGLHMASHALALGIALAAYAYTRRNAGSATFSFGAGKVNSLAGFTGAMLLWLFAAIMTIESLERFGNPVSIEFNHAILVAVVGLLVNAASAWILGGTHETVEALDGTHASLEHSHGVGVESPHPLYGAARAHSHAGEDHNLRSAYLHVIADALTSIFAIVALLCGKLFGLVWLDPAMGILGAALVAYWAWGLLRSTSRVLLDRQAPPPALDAIRHAIEGLGDARLVDLHVWSIGPGISAAILVVDAANPLGADEYRARLPRNLGLVHVTVEVHRAVG
jgi:cation diffusion facilitator family transporter